MNVRRFATTQEMVDWSTEEIAGTLTKAVEATGRATLVVSGGRTPAPILAALSKTSLPWSEVTVTLSDERWVDSTSPLSNERLVRQQLLRAHAAEACFVGLRTGDQSLQASVELASATLSRLALPYDVALLGMGLDGHTASIFPQGAGAVTARESRDVLAGVTPYPLPREAPCSRITHTLYALSQVSRILLLAMHERKLALLNDEGTMEAPALPVVDLVKRAGTRLTVLSST